MRVRQQKWSDREWSMEVFEFQSFNSYLKFKISEQMRTPLGRRKSNLSRLSKTLGYKSPSLLSMVISGRRAPSDELVSALISRWELTPNEREYIRLLAQLSRAEAKGKATSSLHHEIAIIRGKPIKKTLTAAQFSAMSEWYYNVIKQLIGSPEFKNDPQWISQKLKRKVSPTKVQEAIKDLIEIGMIELKPQTNKLQAKIGYTETTHDIPSEAIRLHHLQMLQRAVEALEEQAVEKRHFNSMTLKIDNKKLPEAKKRILTFMRQFHEEFGEAEAKSVFQINVQLFEHTVNSEKV